MNEYILILDDDKELCDFLSQLLQQNKYKVIIGHDGKEGIQLMSDYPVWATIVDDDMPVMSGLDFLKQIHYKYPTVLNIMITGLNRLDTLSECVNYNLIYKYFQKPIDDEDLLSALKEMQTLYQLKKELITQQKNFKTELQIKGTDPEDLLRIYEKFFVENIKLIQLGQFSLSLLRQLQPPLHLIRLNLDFMDKSKKYSEVSARQIRLGLSSIQSTLNIMFNYFSSKRNQKKQKIELEPYMNELIDSFKSLMNEPERFSFQIEFKTNIKAIYFQLSHLELVITSLLSNAIEAAYKEKQPEIKIIFDSDPSYFYIHVIDNGIGLSEEAKDKIFDPFFSTKSNETISVWKEGTPKIGLGLWLVYHLLKEYDSSVNFRRLDKGTEFYIQIPLRKVLLKRK